MGIPIDLIDLMTIYGDEEGSKASHITLVLITQEEELGQPSTLASDYLIWNPLEGELEARNTLDTVFHNILETQPLGEIQPHYDISKNDIVAREQEEGMGKLEISILMNKILANIDPLPTSPYKKNTLLNEED